jgi:hypothetical protein
LYPLTLEKPCERTLPPCFLKSIIPDRN